MELHVPALRYPVEKVTFIGIDPPEEVTSRASLDQGERERGFGLWKDDLYGVGAALEETRRRRGWKGWTKEVLDGILGRDGLEGFEGKEREMVKALLEWKGGENGTEIFPGNLPWVQES